MKYEGFIFDMDGTMVDNMMVHHRAWQLMLAELGLDLSLEEVRQTIHGKNEEILARLFGDRFSPEERRKIAWEKEARYREVFRDSLTLVKGLPEFLDKAMSLNIPMAIGTAAPAENVDFVLDTLDLRPYFRSVVHAGMVTNGKPDPQVFQMAAELAGLAIQNCLVFEDSPTGVHTSLNAGSKTAVITTTHTAPEFAVYDNVVHFFSDYEDAFVLNLIV